MSKWIPRTRGPRPATAAPVRSSPGAAVTRHGLARALSKQGICSRTQAAQWIRDGRVRLNGVVQRDPETPTRVGVDRIDVDGAAIHAGETVWVLMNKPRGYVTTTADERGRDTVYTLLDDNSLPWLAPVGRLDKASEGALLFTNDSVTAARLLAPQTHVAKTYHVQVDCLPDEDWLAQLRAGRYVDGESLSAAAVRELRRGAKNAWLEITLDEGRNRQIRRLLAAFDVQVLRLVRVAIGPLALGELAKGSWRKLTPVEIALLQTAASGA